ncbi:MAG: hypothetical protein KI792_01145 [Alphaproteobacteria bacterium]|nr:hypothetical protein [Alphaproteobacteria bacterium SS10]
MSSGSALAARHDDLFNDHVVDYLGDYFRDCPERFGRLYNRMWQRKSPWVPSFSLMAMVMGPAWFAYRRHYIAMGLSMWVINTMLMIGYFSDHEGWLAIATATAVATWAFCGLFARAIVLTHAARLITRTAERLGEPLLRRRAIWRAGGVDRVTGFGMLAGQATMMFPLAWELVNGPILLWPIL